MIAQNIIITDAISRENINIQPGPIQVNLSMLVGGIDRSIWVNRFKKIRDEQSEYKTSGGERLKAFRANKSKFGKTFVCEMIILSNMSIKQLIVKQSAELQDFFEIDLVLEQLEYINMRKTRIARLALGLATGLLGIPGVGKALTDVAAKATSFISSTVKSATDFIGSVLPF